MDEVSRGAHRTVSWVRATEALAALNLPQSETMVDQMIVFAEALEIFDQRSLTYGEAWREFGPEDKAMHIRNKHLRIEKGISGLETIRRGEEIGMGAGDLEFRRSTLRESVVDSALDITNYAAFLVRQIREEADNGEG